MKRFRYDFLLTLLLFSLAVNVVLLLMPSKIRSPGGSDEARAPQSILSPRKRSQVPRAEKKEKILQAIGPTMVLPRAVSVALLSQVPYTGNGIFSSRDSIFYARWKAECQMMLGATDAEFAAVERAIDQMLDKLAVELREKASINDEGDPRTIDFNIAPLETDYREAFEDSLSSHMDAQMAEDFRDIVFRAGLLASLQSVRKISLDFTPRGLGGGSRPAWVTLRNADRSIASMSGDADRNRLLRVFANLAETSVQE